MEKHLDKLKGKQIIILTIIFVLFTSLVLPYINNLTNNLIGVSESPDTGFGLSLSDYYIMRNRYGEYGIKIYTIMRFTFDIIWPFVYGGFLITSLYYLQKESNVFQSFRLYFIAATAVLFDFLENLLAVLFMNMFPREFDLLVYALKISSTLKWLVLVVSFSMLLYVFIIFIHKKIRNK